MLPEFAECETRIAHNFFDFYFACSGGNMRQVSTDLWGTFAVKDHLVERAFIADALLYDRLVIPTKPANPGGHKWPSSWDLVRQQEILKTLGDLAIPIPWDDRKRGFWQEKLDGSARGERAIARTEFAGDVSADLNDIADAEARGYEATRRVLEDYVSGNYADDELVRKVRATRKAKPGSRVEVVSAYTTYNAFVADFQFTGARQDAGAAKEQRSNYSAPPTLFGWRFFIPDSADHGMVADLKLLEKTVQFAKRSDTIAARDEFYKWLNDVTENRLPAEEARADMEKRIAAFHDIVRSNFAKCAVRYAVKVVDLVAGHFFVNDLANAASELLLGSADILADEKLRRAQTPPNLKVAALFHDARAHFGWRPPAGPAP
jgi:hypothetical protein